MLFCLHVHSVGGVKSSEQINDAERLRNRSTTFTDQPKCVMFYLFLLPLSSNEEIKTRIIRTRTYIIIESRSRCHTALMSRLTKRFYAVESNLSLNYGAN